MNWRNNHQRYGYLSIGLHWLILAVYACIELRELFPKHSDPRNALQTWHFMLGAAGQPIPFFALELPALVNENRELTRSIKKLHASVGEPGDFRMALHAVALFHHYLIQRQRA